MTGLPKNGKSVPHCWGQEVSTQLAQQFAKTAVTAPPLVGCVVWSIISSDNAFPILVCVSSIPAALFSLKFLNFFYTMDGSISVSISLELILSSNCCLGFVMD